MTKTAEYREKNREHLRAYNREYNKKWRRLNGYHNEYNSKRRYPERVKARRALQYAVDIGILKRGCCEVCKKPKAQAHHHDYSKPLEVRWFCPVHHKEYETTQSKLNIKNK